MLCVVNATPNTRRRYSRPVTFDGALEAAASTFTEPAWLARSTSHTPIRSENHWMTDRAILPSIQFAALKNLVSIN
jgi:hypothetical protein